MNSGSTIQYMFLGLCEKKVLRADNCQTSLINEEQDRGAYKGQ